MRENSWETATKRVKTDTKKKKKKEKNKKKKKQERTDESTQKGDVNREQYRSSNQSHGATGRQ